MQDIQKTVLGQLIEKRRERVISKLIQAYNNHELTMEELCGNVGALSELKNLSDDLEREITKAKRKK